MRLSMEAARALLDQVPELESVAILHGWRVPQEYLPPGLVMGRHGALRNPAEIQHMAMQLHACMKQQLDNMIQVLKIIDDHAAELQQKIDQSKRVLNELNAKLADAHDHQRPNA